MICYLDTQVAVWLAEGRIARISRKALSMIQRADVRISPMVMVELGYLHEIGRIGVSAHRIIAKLGGELGAAVCDYPFPIITELALGETWTRDPFDRIIVAHAKANGAAPLLTRDEAIRGHYKNAIW